MVYVLLSFIFAIGLLGQQLSSGSLLSERWRVRIIMLLRSAVEFGIFAVKMTFLAAFYVAFALTDPGLAVEVFIESPAYRGLFHPQQAAKASLEN
jgi:hypothetical protein